MSQEFSDVDRPLSERIGILAVDVRRFSKHNDVQQRTIVDLLPDILQQAAERAGLTALWGDNVFRAFRGDGYLLGMSPNLVSAVVDRFFDSLQNELRRRSTGLRSSGVELRVRTSLHLGSVESFDALLTDSPTGRIMVDVNRMVEAPPVRALLDNSDPKVTFVASVLSRTVMEDVVEAGRTARQPSEFIEAPLHVEAKDYSGKGYLRVPALSGDLLRFGLLWGQPEPAVDEGKSAPHQPAAQVSNAMSGHAGNATLARDVQGGISHGLVRDMVSGVSVTGNGNVTAGGDVDQSSTKQEFSGEFRTRGDSNFGPSSGRRTGTAGR